MAVQSTIVSQQFTNVVVNVPLVVNIQTSGVVSEIYVYYGALYSPAVQGPDYSVVIDPGLMFFTIIPLQPLLDKINYDGTNVIYAVRELPLTSDFDYDSSLVRERVVAEYDRLWMVEQQNLSKFGGLPPVKTWNGRIGDVVMSPVDVSNVGGALLNSPVFIGTPKAPTPIPGDASTRLATTKYVDDATYVGVTQNAVTSWNGQQGNVTYALQLSDVIGVGGAPIASPVFTGDPRAPTPAPGDNDTSIATTAFVQTTIAAVSSGVVSWNARTGTVVMTSADITAAGGALSTQLPVASAAVPQMDGTGIVGVATTWARGDHVHPSDTSRAPLASPAFSGVPTAPTAAPGTNTTQLATTAFMAAMVPSGTILPFASSAAPTGWAICNGQNINRAANPNLFTAIGTTYGIGDGSTTFGVPDIRGRTIFGLDPSNATARLTASATGGISAAALGNVGGEQAHVQTANELFAHNHGGAITGGASSGSLSGSSLSGGSTDAQGLHTHSVLLSNLAALTASGKVTNASGAMTGGFIDSQGSHGHNAYGTPVGTVSGSATGAIPTSGSSTAANEVPPGIVLNYIIRLG